MGCSACPSSSWQHGVFSVHSESCVSSSRVRVWVRLFLKSIQRFCNSHCATYTFWISPLNCSNACCVPRCDYQWPCGQVLDHNGLQDLDSLPPMPALRALSLNHNVLDNLDLAVIAVQSKCPALTFLSLLGVAHCCFTPGLYQR